MQLERYQAEAGEDENGNEISGYAPPVEVLVFGWENPRTRRSDEPVLAGHERVLVDVDLYAPQSLNIAPKDRLILNGKRFEVLGYPDDPNNNPWWRPGLVTVSLRRIEG